MQNEGKGMGRVLIMDDDRIVRETISKLLEFLGYAVMAAKDGGEALEMFRHADRRRQSI